MQNQDIHTFDDEDSSRGIPIRDILKIALRNWYWFVVSVSICTAFAFLYAKSVTQLYVAEAVIMIKTDTKKGGGASESAIFADMGLGSSVGIVENEIPILRSTALMEAVVKRLRLDVTYTVHPLLRTVDIYARSPIEVVFPDKRFKKGAYLNVTPLSANRFKYAVADSSNNFVWRDANFGDTLSVWAETFVIRTTPFFNDNAINETIRVSVSDVRSKAKSILRNLTVRRADKVTGILNLLLEDHSFQCAVDILNTLIVVYNEDVINDKNRVAYNTEKFIIERITAIYQDLGGIDGQIEQLKQENKITDFSASSNLLLETGSRYKNEVIAIETEISLVRFIKDYLSDPAKRDELIPTNTGISDVGIESQIVRYNEVRMCLDKLLANSGANNPVTIELFNSLNVTKANMIRSIDNLLASLDIKRDQALRQENLTSLRIASVPTQEKRVNDVVRQQKIKEELYLYLLKKREENALNLAITESNAKIVEQADGVNLPIVPAERIYIMIAVIVGLSLPMSVILMIQWIRLLDTKIHNKQDVEKLSSIPVIGELPCKRKDQVGAEIMISETGRDRISEAFRVMRSNMDYIAKKQDNTAFVIQLTSTIPGEGKSYVAINLALSYAHTGKRVLVIDLDLRKGKMSRIVDRQTVKGMSEYLSGKVDDIDLIINKGVENQNLDVITTGAIPPNPGNLLMSDRFESLVSTLKQHYDYIFMDTVPFAVVADALIINRVADITLYVMRNNMIDKHQLPELEKIYNANKMKNLTILLTDVEIDVKRYGYGYVEGEN